MSWFRAHGRLMCGSCRAVISAGDPVRRTSAGRLRCQWCALALFGESPPDFVDELRAPVGAAHSGFVTAGYLARRSRWRTKP